MRVETLRRRADLLDAVRTFFKRREFLEVETPLASCEAIPERPIELCAIVGDGRLLQASPEMHHKRLLCAGLGPIFEVTKSFRGREVGDRHNPEFTILEWYQPGGTLADAVALTTELLTETIGAPALREVTYREAFRRSLGVDPHAASLQELKRLVTERSPCPVEPFESDDRDEWLNVLLAMCVEPTLGIDAPEALTHYPASQAALASIARDPCGAEVSSRFEVYWRGIELANGYQELTDPVELRGRLEHANRERLAAGLPAVPMPERLLADMAAPGLPPCCGVAVGFDRLVMLATGARTIGEVRAFAGLG